MKIEGNPILSWVKARWSTRRKTFCIAVILCVAYWAWPNIESHSDKMIPEEEINVPNPKTYDADNWICNPDGILSEDVANEINGMLQQLEDSLTIEVTVVALNSIGRNEPHDFALSLFDKWGVGKAADDNGLLMLLTRDIRDITFKTGYGLEDVLPDIICKKIQMDVMTPYLREDDWDKGMTEGVKAVVATLYGSDYETTPPEGWIKKFYRTTPSIVFAVFGLLLFLINWLVWKSVVWRMRPKDESAEAALALLVTCKPFTLRTLIGFFWLVPVWPAMLGIVLWYFGIQKRKTVQRSRTCPKCSQETLREIPVSEMMKLQDLLTECDRKEIELKTVYIRVYKCASCGEYVKVRIPLEKDGYEHCPACRSITLHKEEKYRTVEEPTTISEGLREACHKCLYCGAEYIVSYKIPKIRSSSNDSRSSGGGSFGGGSSGGGGASSRF